MAMRERATGGGGAGNGKREIGRVRKRVKIREMEKEAAGERGRETGSWMLGFDDIPE